MLKSTILLYFTLVAGKCFLTHPEVKVHALWLVSRHGVDVMWCLEHCVSLVRR